MPDHGRHTDARRASVAIAPLTAAVLLLATAGCSASADSAPQSLQPATTGTSAAPGEQQDPSKVGDPTAAGAKSPLCKVPPAPLGPNDPQPGFTVVVNVANNSSHDLNFVGYEPDASVSQMELPPYSTIKAGGTDRITVYSCRTPGVQGTLTWRVVGTELQVTAEVSDLSIGRNQIVCGPQGSAPRALVQTRCDIGYNWHPDAHLAITDA